MLKILARILIILLVAGALGGGLFLLVNNGAVTLAGVDGGPNGRLQLANGVTSGLANSSSASLPGFQAGGHDFGGRDAAGGGLDTLLKNLGLVALITAGVAVLQKLIRLAQRRKPAPAS